MHYQRCLAQLRSKDKSIEKYIYLSQLKDADPGMFYRMCLANMAVCFGFWHASAVHLPESQSCPKRFAGPGSRGLAWGMGQA